jgi:mannose-6-phosphate isomerase-like protein (cupin superfamily)
MQTRIHDTNQIVEGSEAKLAKHNLFETPRFFVDVYVLRAGQVQAAHTHTAEDKCYHVLAGRGTVTSGDERLAVGPGHIVFCPAGEAHGVENSGQEDLRLLVFMAPHPRAKQVVKR